MASGKIPSNPDLPLGRDIANLARHGANFRNAAAELSRRVGKYNDDNTTLATYSGIPSGQVQAFRDLLARVVGETCDVVLAGQGITEGNQTHTRQFLDAIG